MTTATALRTVVAVNLDAWLDLIDDGIDLTPADELFGSGGDLDWGRPVVEDDATVSLTVHVDVPASEAASEAFVPGLTAWRNRAGVVVLTPEQQKARAGWLSEVTGCPAAAPTRRARRFPFGARR